MEVAIKFCTTIFLLACKTLHDKIYLHLRYRLQEIFD